MNRAQRIALARFGVPVPVEPVIPPSHSPVRCGCYDAMDDLYELSEPLDNRYLSIPLSAGRVICQPSWALPCS